MSEFYGLVGDLLNGITDSLRQHEKIKWVPVRYEEVVAFAGAHCAGAHDQVVALGSKLKAPVVHALRGKEHVEWDNPFDVGMTDLIGFSSGYYAMLTADCASHIRNSDLFWVTIIALALITTFALRERGAAVAGRVSVQPQPAR